MFPMLTTPFGSTLATIVGPREKGNVDVLEDEKQLVEVTEYLRTPLTSAVDGVYRPAGL